MRFKVCPELKQIETKASMVLGGTARTQTHFSTCIGWECAAFYHERGHFRCRKFVTVLEIHEDEKEDDHGT